MFRFIGNTSVCGGITAVAFSVRGIAYLSLSHALLWIVMALSFSGISTELPSPGLLRSPWIYLCLGHISASVQHIFTFLRSTRSTPTSAFQPLAVPTSSSSVERHSLAHVSMVSQTISTTDTSNEQSSFEKRIGDCTTFRVVSASQAWSTSNQHYI